MLVTFKSKAAAEVTMYKEHARPILEMLDKDVDRGVITAEETAHAIEVIEAAIASSRANPLATEAEGEDDLPQAETVSFSARVFPLLEMLRAAHKMQREVMWGV
jgi:hypothetical protein